MTLMSGVRAMKSGRRRRSFRTGGHRNWNNLVRPLVKKLKSHDDQLQAYEDQVAALKLQVSELEERSDLLNSQLETSKNHTFALQGAIWDAVPPSVIADTYKDLLEFVSSWVSNRVEALEDDPADRRSALNYSANRKAATATLREWIRNGPDLQRIFGILGSDEDVITSLIWCNLMWTIFFPEGPVYTEEYANRLRIVGELERQISANSTFFTSLDSLDCVVLKPNTRQRLDPAKHLAGVELPELHERLTKLCAITTALTTRHISDQYGLGPTEILVKQSVLVLLDSVDDVEGLGRSFLDELTFPRYWRGMSRS